MNSYQYKRGFCLLMTNQLELSSYEWIRFAIEKCETFVLGIPDEWTVARLYGNALQYSVETVKQFWLETGWVSEVVVIDAEHLSYSKAYEIISFDICFYGSEYGIVFENDKKFMKTRGICFEPLFPDKRVNVLGGDALRIALDDVQRHQSIVLFGTGVYFDIYMQQYGEKYKPAYAVDNDASKWNTEKRGIKIYKPEYLFKEKKEDVLVIVCSKKYNQMVLDIKNAGDFNYRTLIYQNQIAMLEEFAISSSRERDYLKKSHEILTMLMKEFDRVCQANHLHYYIICGSLIGVVRHKGMIPWDDDIDIAMPRADYKKLKKIAKKEWNNDTFKYIDYADIGGGAFLDCMPRLFYMKERLPMKCVDKVYGKATADIEDRVFLDIYVMDNAHENKTIHNLTINVMKGIYNLMMGHRAFVDYDEYRGVIPEKTIKWMKRLHSVGSILPIHFLAFWYDAFARSANFSKKSKNYIMESCAIRCIELKYPKEHFGEGLRLPFEDIEVMVPSDYDAQLKAMRYNNYMELPPMFIRKPSHYFNSDIEIW